MMHTCCAFTVTQPHYYPYSTSKPWKQHIYPCPLLASQFALITRNQLRNGYSDTIYSDTPHVLIPMASLSSPPPSFSSLSTGVNDISTISTSASSCNQVSNGNAAKGSGTTARGRRLPLPKDLSVAIKEVPRKIVVVALSGFVTDEEVQNREATLQNAAKNDSQFHVSIGALVEVAQVTWTNLNKVAISLSGNENGNVQ